MCERGVTVADHRALTRWVVTPTGSIEPENADLPGRRRFPRLRSRSRSPSRPKTKARWPATGPVRADSGQSHRRRPHPSDVAIASVQAVAGGSWRSGERDLLTGWLGRLGSQAPPHSRRRPSPLRRSTLGRSSRRLRRGSPDRAGRLGRSPDRPEARDPNTWSATRSGWPDWGGREREMAHPLGRPARVARRPKQRRSPSARSGRP